MNILRAILSLLIIVGLNCDSKTPDTVKVKTGAEMLIAHHLDELRGQKVGLVMNPTARIGDVHVLDTLMSEGVNITALFAPEHGVRGNYSDGERIENGIDTQSGLPVFSLYGLRKSQRLRCSQKLILSYSTCRMLVHVFTHTIPRSKM
jgi:uncharacterized protein YbbC (DUF1343 family)